MITKQDMQYFNENDNYKCKICDNLIEPQNSEVIKRLFRVSILKYCPCCNALTETIMSKQEFKRLLNNLKANNK